MSDPASDNCSPNSDWPEANKTVSATVNTTRSRAPAEVLASVARVSAALRQSSRFELLDLDGCDALDVLVSPLFTGALNAVRTQRLPAARSPLARAKTWASRVKQRWNERRRGALAAAIGKTDILFWPREITHIAVLNPVAEVLKSRGSEYRFVTSDLKTFNDARLAGLNPSLAGAAWPSEIRRAAANGRRRARQLVRQGTPANLLPEDPDGELITASMHRTLCLHLENAAVATATGRLVLEHFRPRVLVVGNDLTMEGRAACLEASRRGIPTAAFMHGNITGGVLHGEHCADQLLVFGEAHRRILMDLGTDSSHITICGAPQLDRRVRPSQTIDPRLKAGLKLRDGHPWILVATSGPGQSVSHAHHAQVVENLARLARSLPDVPMVCKLHRKDRVEYYDDLLSQCADLNVSVVPRSNTAYPYDIFEWLKGCSLVLTGASTVAVEAMLMNVPVITMDFFGELTNVDFIEAGATVHVTSAEELQTAVHSVLKSGLPAEVQASVRKYVEDAFCSLDGKSAERGANALVEMATAGTGR
jgi:UDP-N-acetylglucosamine 2-epimerase